MMASTRLMPVAAPRARLPRAPHLGAFKFLSVGRTHEGGVRTLNEDAFLDRAGDRPLGRRGRHGRPRRAAKSPANASCEALERVDAFGSAYAFRDGVCAALTDANRDLIDASFGRKSGPIGATVVSLLAYEGHYACVWAGDSRAYLYRAGDLKRLTRDHSVVQALVDAGELRQEEARGPCALATSSRARSARAARLNSTACTAASFRATASCSAPTA